MTTLVNIVLLGTLAANTLLSFSRPRQGTAGYVLLSFVAPHLRLGGTALPYEVLAFLPVGLVVFYRERFRIRARIEYGLWAVYFVLAFTATLVSVGKYGSEVNWIPVFGWGRAFFVLLLANRVLYRRDVIRVLTTIIAINCVLSIGQIFIPGVLDITHALYSQESMAPLNRYFEEGVIPRAVGTMGTPVDLGAFSLITFGVTFECILRKGYSHLLIISILLSLLVGVLSLSKTAILGIPILLGVGATIRIGGTLINGIRVYLKRLFVVSLVFVVGGIFVWYLVGLLNDAGLNIYYYLSFFKTPLEAFETRYEAGSGGLARTIDVAMENFLTGVGFTAPKGEFLGDSTYVVVFHTAGIWGLMIVFMLYISLVYRAILVKKITLLIPLLAIFILGFATARLFALEGIIVIVYTLTYNKHVREKVP